MLRWLRWSGFRKADPPVEVDANLFRVVRESGRDFYATGEIAQVKRKLLNGAYHELICIRIPPDRTGHYRDLCQDRSLVSKILQTERRAFDRRIWTEVYFSNRVPVGTPTATHWIIFRYCLPSGSGRSLVEWAFDFGGYPAVASADEIAGTVCRFIVFLAQSEDQYVGLFLPYEKSRAFWLTAIARSVIAMVVGKTVDDRCGLGGGLGMMSDRSQPMPFKSPAPD